MTLNGFNVPVPGRWARSHPHRHQHVERGGLVVLAEQGRGGGVGRVDYDAVSPSICPQNVEQVAGVEAYDLEQIGAIITGYFLRRVAILRAR